MLEVKVETVDGVLKAEFTMTQFGVESVSHDVFGPYIGRYPCDLELLSVWVDFKPCKVASMIGFSTRLEELFVGATFWGVNGCDTLPAFFYSTINIADAFFRFLLDKLDFKTGVVRGY